MKIFQGVRSTAKQVPYVEVNKDTVYVRNDIERVEEVDFSGWEYNEVQYGLQEYIENLTTNSDTDAMALLLSMMMSEIDFLKDRLKALEGGVK
jgi:hypothetical protein